MHSHLRTLSVLLKQTLCLFTPLFNIRIPPLKDISHIQIIGFQTLPTRDNITDNRTRVLMKIDLEKRNHQPKAFLNENEPPRLSQAPSPQSPKQNKAEKE